MLLKYMSPRTYSRRWEKLRNLVKSRIVIPVTFWLAIFPLQSFAEHTVLYIAPPTREFREQFSDLAARANKARPGLFRFEFVEFQRHTHLMSSDEIAAQILPLLARKPLALVTRNLDIAKAVSNSKLPVQVVVGGLADPVGYGVVKSLTAQESDITGYSQFIMEMDEKKLSILRSIAPKSKRVGLLLDQYIKQQRIVGKGGEFKYTVDGLDIVPFVISNADEAVGVIRKSKALGIDSWYIRLMVANYDDDDARKMVTETNNQNLPAIFDSMRFVRFGGLIAYQQVIPDPEDIWLRDLLMLAEGLRAGQVPFERPRHFFTSLNIETAKRLKISIPNSLMRRVDIVFPCTATLPLDCESATPPAY